jgi:undecaprenyl-diphosphatase
MDLLAAAILGIVQGLTEFLPISSSAHLILVPWLLGWRPEGIEFDVSLHVGTALAILCFFWRDWLVLAREAVLGLAKREPFANAERRLVWYIVIGTVPAAVIGLAFERRVEETLRSPLITVVTLTALGVVLYAADRVSTRRRTLADFKLADALWIGMSQAVALIPGVSRSGITMSTALFLNADRASAARFSFLLAAPVIVGGGMLEGLHLFNAARLGSAGVAGAVTISWGAFVVGVACATVTGLLCIRFFLRYLQTRSFLPFVIYRFALAGIVLAFYYRHF